MENRSGKLINNLSGELSYYSFRPTPLPPSPQIEINKEILETLIHANKEIAYLNGLSSNIPNISLFVSMYIRKEALLSSQIEGTQCTLDDILNPFLEKNENMDVSDVLNYIKATEFAINRLNTLPLCSRLIKETHNVLLDNVRGQEKNPGEFRTSQNWIGGQGSTIKNARYIPPNVEDMLASMSDLEKFINYDETLDSLIQVALIHYQFETIHPFLDGNGRIGRLLITLFLMQKGILNTPALYISYYLKANRIEYYDRMTQVRKNGDYEQWVLFFLKAIASSAEDAIDTIDNLSKLHEKNYKLISERFITRKKATILKVFDYLEHYPIIDLQNTATSLKISYNTVSSAIDELQKLGIVIENTKAHRGRIFSYSSYLQILRKDT